MTMNNIIIELKLSVQVQVMIRFCHIHWNVYSILHKLGMLVTRITEFIQSHITQNETDKMHDFSSPAPLNNYLLFGTLYAMAVRVLVENGLRRRRRTPNITEGNAVTQPLKARP